MTYLPPGSHACFKIWCVLHSFLLKKESFLNTSGLLKAPGEYWLGAGSDSTSVYENKSKINNHLVLFLECYMPKIKSIQHNLGENGDERFLQFDWLTPFLSAIWERFSEIRGFHCES